MVRLRRCTFFPLATALLVSAAVPAHALEIRALHTSYGLSEFERSGAGVAIRVGAVAGEFGGLVAHKLCHGVLFPVCSPAFLDACGLARAEDMAQVPLLDSTIAPDGWPTWLAAAAERGADVSGVDLHRARRFDMFAMSVMAASRGAGVDLGRSPMVDHWLAGGDLVAPFDLRVTSERAYWLICRPETQSRPEFLVFRDWLLEELAS